jgi:hypothetical protein
MAGQGKHLRLNSVFFVITLILYLIGQLLIGTYVPQEDAFYFDAPADIDFLYYAGIIEQMKHSFPPQNPAFGGVTLSQSFLQYYPTVAVSLVVNSYLAIRIMNVVYLLLFAVILRRYFPRGWGVGLAIIASGSVGFGLINSLGIDLIARGFNHFPFFIILTISLFERDKKWLRYGSLFLLGWLHSFSGLLAFLYFAVMAITKRFDRLSLIDSVVCLLGLISAASITLGVADKPFYFPFVEGFRFDLTNLWMHAVPALILVIAARHVGIYILYSVGFLFGLVFHYNPFFPVFILYFSAGWAAAEIIKTRSFTPVFPRVLAGLLVIGFAYGAISKYDSRAGNFIPLVDREYAAAGEWLEENTPPDAVVLAMPIEPGWICRLMEKRALYLGFIPHVSHLGIDWRKRAQKTISYFRNPSVYLADTDYVVFGPIERNLFAGFDLRDDPVYRKGNVQIWKTSR